MPQVIKTNIYSLNTQRHLNGSQSALAQSLQRLSSGMRVNSAKDDAAGLAISERMSAQIGGLDMARRNANDGVSLSQTAESALSTLGEMLRRIRDLAVQSANATNSDADRVALNEEVTQLKMEINRIGAETHFNGRPLLDGSFTNQYFQIGSEAGQTTIVNLTDARAISMGAQFSSQSLEFSFGNTNAIAQGNQMYFDINGVRITVRQTAATGDYSNLKDAINKVAHQTNVRAEYRDPTNPSLGLNLKGVSFDIGNMILRSDDGTPIVPAAYPTYSASQMSGTHPVGNGSAGMDNFGASSNYIPAQTLTVAGNGGTEHLNIPAGATAKEVADLVNSIKAETGVEASARSVAYLRELTGDGIIGFKLYGSNSAGIDVSADVTTDNLTNLATAINDVSEKTGITAVLSVDKRSIQLINENGEDIGIEDFFSSNTTPADARISVYGPTSTGEDYVGGVGNVLPAGVAVVLHGDGSAASMAADSTRVAGRVTFFSQYSYRVETTETTAQHSLISGEKVYPSKISINDIDISTREGADVAIRSVDAALTAVSSNRAKLGAIQNRFESAITNLQAVSENLSAARSRIRDTDYALETSNMASAQILQQAGVSMMTQANALPQNVLNLLQGL